MTSRIALAGAFLARQPLKLLLAFVVVSLLAGERFPLSQYPMYANPGPNTWYVYVTDGNDQPIALRKSFSVTTPALKKLYATRLQGLPPDQAGKAVLAFIVDTGTIRSAPLPTTLRLWRVDLAIAQQDITSQRHVVADYHLR